MIRILALAGVFAMLATFDVGGFYWGAGALTIIAVFAAMV